MVDIASAPEAKSSKAPQVEDRLHKRVSNKWRALWDKKLYPICLNSGLAIVLYVSAVFLGAYGSVFSPEIRDTFHWPPWKGEFLPVAASFWIGLIFITALFAGRQVARDQARREAQKGFDEARDVLSNDIGRLGADLDRLEGSVRKSPPPDAVAYFDKAVRACFRAMRELGLAYREGRVTRDDVDQAIRIILNGTVVLVELFDRGAVYSALAKRRHEEEYGINIMLFCSPASLTSEKIEDLRSDLRFVLPETCVTTLRGLLVLQPELSTTTATEASVPDEKLVRTVLPVPKDEAFRKPSGDILWRMLPGAPWSYCRGEFVIYSDTQMLSAWCRKNGFDEYICAEVERYFAERRQLYGSFCSFPLGDPQPRQGANSPGNASDTVVGVVNVHRTTPGLLSTSGPLSIVAHPSGESLFALLRPFRMLLLDLLRLRAEVPLSHRAGREGSPLDGPAAGSEDERHGESLD